jgi:acetyltransferase
MARFHATLSERSIEHERLTRICFVDYDREMALVAERLDPQAGEREILAAGRLTKADQSNEGEFAMLISDKFQAMDSKPRRSSGFSKSGAPKDSIV